MNTEVFERIADLGVVPVLCPPSADDAEPLVDAFCKGGVPAFEVILRRPCALEVIRRVHTAFPQVALGAGTVFTKEQVDAAKAAGASYIVSPGFDPELLKYCEEQELPYLPGCVTPREMTIAYVKHGLRHLKYFPAEQSGGTASLTLVHGPFPECKFVVTGGIGPANMGGYLDKAFVGAMGSSFFAPQGLIIAKEWEKITANCRLAMDISLGFELAHIGINHANEEEALAAANRFATLFRMPIKPSNSAIFTGTGIENRKAPFHGAKGHIGFTTRSVRRALAYYRKNGIPVLEDSIRRAADGTPESFYLAEEVAGFAVHVMKKKEPEVVEGAKK